MPPKKKPGDDAPKPKKKSEPRTRNTPTPSGIMTRVAPTRAQRAASLANAGDARPQGIDAGRAHGCLNAEYVLAGWVETTASATFGEPVDPAEGRPWGSAARATSD